MKLSRLEIYGFKSFPQRTDIRFDDGITGIVGPNGSGKSNIADAVRWVLGEQSARALRGSKMEDVIFAGTQKRRLMPYCEVSLVFDNADKKLKSPHTEVMVTRRVYRSGEGEYFLNQKSCRLKDIVELFHDTGIGREGYSLIGQGHIDVILSGKGEERRAAFEEAAGIVGFRSRKEEAERKLTRTQEHLLRVSDLLEELSGRLGPMKEQSETARQYLALSARLKHLDANIFLVRHERLDKRIASLRETQQGISALIAQHEADIARLQEQRDRTDEQLSQAESVAEKLSDSLRTAENKLREQAVQAERGASLLKSARDEEEQIILDLGDTASSIAELRKTLAGTADDAGKQEALVKQADEALRLLEEQAETEINRRLEHEEALEAHRNLILQAANSRSDARERQARQQAMYTQAQQRMREIGDQENQLRSALDIARTDSEGADEALKQTKAAVEGMYRDLHQLEEELLSLRSAAQTARAAMEASGQAFQRDKARLNAMEEMSRANEGFFQPVKQALAYAEGHQGVHGVVARLIEVPKELETAVEMVLGSALQHIVTEDEETAKELIQYLREKRLGRTTFLPLTAVHGRTLNQQERQALLMPGCLGVASELLEYDPRYRGIVESLLGRTVVARDLNAAIAISRQARQAFHVVTLQGDVMRAGGAMTGGSIQSRTVSLLGREREIKELSEALVLRSQELESLNASWNTSRQAEEAGRARLDQARARAQDEEIGIARDEERASQAGLRLTQANSRLEQALAARSQLAEMMAELEADLNQAGEASRVIEQDREQMEQTEAVLKEALAKARDKAEASRLALEAGRERRAQLAHQFDLHHRDSQRLEKELKALEQRRGSLEVKQANMKTRIAQEQDNLAAQNLQVEALTESVESLRGETTRQEAVRRELSAMARALMQETEQLHRRHSEDSQRLHKGEISLTRLEEEQSTMVQTLWNTYEMTFALAEEFRETERFELPAFEREAGDIRKQIKEMGAINIHALDEYAATQTRFDDLSAQRDDAAQAREDLLNLIKRLQGQMEKQFVREFALLNEYFAETFKRLFRGGQASLSLADPSQPLDCEIQIKAQPPGKKLQLLSLLSGGERTLTAIAILFAMLKLKPTPFCVLDEIEAALDDANIDSFAEYLAEYAKSTQFIVITHRKGTMESCDMLYGVTMREKGVSDIISVNLQEYTA